MELVSLLIALFAILISIIAIKWGTYTSKKKRKYIRKRINILFLIVLACAVGVVLFSIFNKKREQEQSIEQANYIYKRDYNEVVFEFERSNYLEAAKKLNNILSYVDYDEKNYIGLNRFLSICYFMEGLKDLDKKDYYYDKSIEISKRLLFSDIELTEEQLFEIQYDLGLAYVFSENELYFDDLTNVIYNMESKMEQNENILSNLGEDSFLFAFYYDEKFKRNHQKDDLNKAINYYDKSLKDEKIVRNDTIERNAHYYYKIRATECYFRCALDDMINKNDINKIQNFKKSIDIYNDLVNVCDYNKDPYIYYLSAKQLARCYYFLNDKDNAYKNFVTFIYYDNIDLDYLIKGSYVFAVLDINQEEIDILLNRYNRLMNKYQEESDITNLCEVKFELVVCYYFLSEKQNSINYYLSGKAILDEINEKYIDYYEADKKELIKNYNDLYNDLYSKIDINNN